MKNAQIKVGFIGLGNMGGPLAQNLVGKVDLTVFDFSAERRAAFKKLGTKAAENGIDVAKSCEIVLTCLPSSKDVQRALFGEGGVPGFSAALKSGAMVIDMTTGNPATTREISAKLSQQNVAFVDAPVSGGPRGAREGSIAIIVGGSADQFKHASTVLDLISRNVIHAGPVGSGHAVKAGNNLLNLICRLATFEIVSMLVKDGVDPATANAIIQKSSGRNYATEITLPDNILTGKMMQGFTTALMQKDSNIALDMAEILGLEMPFGGLARDILQDVVSEHGLNADMSTVALTYERKTGARIRPKS